MAKRRDSMAARQRYAGAAPLPKHIRDMLEGQQQQIEQLTGLLKSMAGVGGPDLTVSELCDKWEVSLRGQRAASTMSAVTCRLGTIRTATSEEWQGAFGELTVSQLTPEHFEAYQRMRRRAVSDGTVRAEAIVLRSVLNWAKKKKLVRSNPFDGGEMLYEVRTRQTVYKPMQVYAVRNWLMARATEVRHSYPLSAERYLDAAAAVLACATTGIRPKELCLLQVHQLRAGSRDVTITEKQSKGGYSGRTIRLSEEAHAELRARAEGRKDGPILRAGYRGISVRWREACKAMGIVGADGERPDWYALRHTFASAAANKVPVWALMKAMGHKKVTTTQRYVKIDFSETAIAFESVHTHLSDNGGEAHDE